jgi:hypothetical protein
MYRVATAADKQPQRTVGQELGEVVTIILVQLLLLIKRQ